MFLNSALKASSILRYKILLVCILTALSHANQAQDQSVQSLKGHKGDFYFYWGWNGSQYTKSDISFWGDNYNFKLAKVVAEDRQSHFDLNKYFNPAYATIPQYDFRIGYFINDKYNISIGLDHMKYVAVQNQTVRITGNIANSQTPYDGTYQDQDIIIASDFLIFEHTDGLNYLNISFRRFDQLLDLNHFKIGITEGLEFGVLVPRTNATLLNNSRYDEFHLSGFGVNPVIGLNFAIYKHFFIQPELKGGFITMPDIRTTYNESDHASQKFFFAEFNLVFGATINIHKKGMKI